MKAAVYTAPTIEPITLADLKLHLKLDSETFAGNIASSQSIVPGSHAVTVGYTLIGTGVDVLGKTAVVFLDSGTNLATGTVDVKIQDSDDNVIFTDWTGGGFTQVTTANDNAIQEKAYTGAKQYIRVVARILLAACEFGVSILVNSSTTDEDDLLTALITASRQYAEDVTNRKFLTQTWDYYLQDWPYYDDYIMLPWGNLQSAGFSVTYKDSTGAPTIMTVTTDYYVETNGEGYGRIVLPYGVSWPTATLYTSNPITIRFTCGWTAAALVPSHIRTAIKMICADLFEQRGEPIVGQYTVVENKAIERLLWAARLWREF